MRAPAGPPVDSQQTATVKKYRRRLLAFIRQRVRSPEDAEDVLQDVFYQLLRADALLRPVDQVSAWLYRVARNQITDYFRKKRESAWPESEQDDEGDGGDFDAVDLRDLLFNDHEAAEAPYTRRLFWAVLEKALLELPDEQRQVFVRTEFHGDTFKMLAEESEVAVNTLISRKHYAVNHLRKRLRWVYEALVDASL